MEKHIITAENIEISEARLLKALHIDSDDDFYETACEMRLAAIKTARPKAVYITAAPDFNGEAAVINGADFPEPFVREMLEGCGAVMPYAATCGCEIDEWAQSFSDVFERFAADVIKQLCLNAVRKKLTAAALEFFGGNKKISSINPGSLAEWPLSGQKPLFSSLGGVTADIGIVLSDSLLMSPNKSVSGIMFAADESFHNCQLCPRKVCPNRRAEFAGH